MPTGSVGARRSPGAFRCIFDRCRGACCRVQNLDLAHASGHPGNDSGTACRACKFDGSHPHRITATTFGSGTGHTQSGPTRCTAPGTPSWSWLGTGFWSLAGKGRRSAPRRQGAGTRSAQRTAGSGSMGIPGPQGSWPQQTTRAANHAPVSYTHPTRPTTLRVSFSRASDRVQKTQLQIKMIDLDEI